MSTPSRPVFLKEGPASPCVLHGRNLSWTNCSTLSAAMGIDKSTLGRLRFSGCDVRDATGDFVGGTSIPQVAAVAAIHGVATEQHVGSKVCTPFYAAYQNALGRGYILQGNTQPSGRGNVNHAIWVNESTGGTPGAPASCLVFDPWSAGPAWWSWAKVKAFAAALHPYGEADPRLLGPGRFYALIFPDTEPHFHSRYGGARSSPFPDRLIAHSPAAGRRVNVRTRPDRINPADIAGTLATGTAWVAYQVTKSGIALAGSKTWYGDHSGARWIHSSGVTGVGGAS